MSYLWLRHTGDIMAGQGKNHFNEQFPGHSPNFLSPYAGLSWMLWRNCILGGTQNDLSTKWPVFPPLRSMPGLTLHHDGSMGQHCHPLVMKSLWTFTWVPSQSGTLWPCKNKLKVIDTANWHWNKISLMWLFSNISGDAKHTYRKMVRAQALGPHL